MKDDFGSDEKSVLEQQAIDGLDVDFVGLSEICSKSKYLAGISTRVYDADGGAHTIEHEDVAAHPGDITMKYYADRTIKLVNN